MSNKTTDTQIQLTGKETVTDVDQDELHKNFKSIIKNKDN